jgi:tetratricopeptide (TPR) repeat protein
MCSNEHDQSEEIANSHFQSAWNAYRDGSFVVALSHLDAAVRLASNSATRSVYLTTQGGFLNRLGLPDRAIIVCEEAVSLVPGNYYAWSQLGLAFLRLKRYEDAARCLSKLIELHPDHAGYTLLAGAQLHFNPQAALQSAEKALEIDPSWEEALGICELAKRRLGIVQGKN